MNYPYYGQMVPQAPDQLGQLRQQYMQPFQQQQTQEERIWVQGEDAARAYLVTANGFVRLWDTNKNVFYEKRADGSGRPSLETYEYKRIDMDPNEKNGYEDRIKELEHRIAALESRTNEQSNDDVTRV